MVPLAKLNIKLQVGYAIYAMFIRPMIKSSNREKLLHIISSRYICGEIDTEAYRKLEKI